MRFYRTVVSSSILAFLFSITGCGSSSNGSSSPTTSKVNEWTWEGGSSTASTQSLALPGVYGTLGVAAASNVPGARERAVSWTDSGNNLWLLGGWGVDSTGMPGLLNDLWEFSPASKAWTWVSGANFVGSNFGVPGVYGTLGVAATGNVPGGRDYAVSWIDSSGNLWLFGGTGFDSTGAYGNLNDLWEFNSASNKWTWVSGANSITGASSVPGALGVASAGNVPGGRDPASSWIDRSGNLWLFGGYGFDPIESVGSLNDLWEFRPASKEWTWVSGANTEYGLNGSMHDFYGTLGVASKGNIPGGRSSAVSWIDGSGSLWLFGGYGFDSTGREGWLNDLWKFDPITSEWTWMSGANSINSSGIYGALGITAVGNVPGGRGSSVSWIDLSGILWLFGGYGFDSTRTIGSLNDLWKFDPAANEWVWVSGVNSVGSNEGASVVYGTLGVTAAGNVPGGRSSSVSWTDNSGNLWLFGGQGVNSSGGGVFLNDLWKYQP